MLEETPKNSSRTRNLGITGITALTGCVSLVVIFVALLLGLTIDRIIGRRGLATICLLVASVPLSLYLMIQMALYLVKQIPPPPSPGPTTTRRKTFYEEKEE